MQLIYGAAAAALADLSLVAAIMTLKLGAQSTAAAEAVRQPAIRLGEQVSLAGTVERAILEPMQQQGPPRLEEEAAVVTDLVPALVRVDR